MNKHTKARRDRGDDSIRVPDKAAGDTEELAREIPAAGKWVANSHFY